MEIRTFTNFWSLERKLYTVYDFTLPVPISLRVLGVFIGTGLPWWGLMWLLHVPTSSPGYLLWLIPPAFFAWFGSKPVFEGKTLFQFLRSHIQYLFENKNYKGLEPDLNKYDVPIEVTTTVMTHRKPRDLSLSR